MHSAEFLAAARRHMERKREIARGAANPERLRTIANTLDRMTDRCLHGRVGSDLERVAGLRRDAEYLRELANTIEAR